MDIRDYMVLADDGCPNTPEHLPEYSSGEIWRVKEFRLRTIEFTVAWVPMDLKLKVMDFGGP